MENPLEKSLTTFFNQVLLDEVDIFEYESIGIKFGCKRTLHFIFNLGEYVDTIDIMNVRVDKKMYGIGCFDTLILKCEEVAKQQKRVLFFKCVTDPTLKEMLLKHKYNIESNSAGVVYRAVNMYKNLSK